MAGKKDGKKGKHMMPGKKHMMKDSEMGHPEMMPKKIGKKGK